MLASALLNEERRRIGTVTMETKAVAVRSLFLKVAEASEERDSPGFCVRDHLNAPPETREKGEVEETSRTLHLLRLAGGHRLC